MKVQTPAPGASNRKGHAASCSVARSGRWPTEQSSFGRCLLVFLHRVADEVVARQKLRIFMDGLIGGARGTRLQSAGVGSVHHRRFRLARRMLIVFWSFLLPQ